MASIKTTLPDQIACVTRIKALLEAQGQEFDASGMDAVEATLQWLWLNENAVREGFKLATALGAIESVEVADVYDAPEGRQKD